MVAQADLCLRCVPGSFCWFCRAAVQIKDLTSADQLFFPSSPAPQIEVARMLEKKGKRLQQDTKQTSTCNKRGTSFRVVNLILIIHIFITSPVNTCIVFIIITIIIIIITIIIIIIIIKEKKQANIGVGF